MVFVVFNCYFGVFLIDICLFNLYRMKKYNFENLVVVISYKNDKYILIIYVIFLRN